MNGVALGIHDVPDGSAQSALNDMEEEITQLATIAEKCGCSAGDITLAKVVSSTSDGAATQSRLNKLLEEKINTGSSDELRKQIENRCAMHLGVNLRLAEISGIRKFLHESHDSPVDIDKIVHQVVKLVGHACWNPRVCTWCAKIP